MTLDHDRSVDAELLESFEDPGLPPHRPRRADVEPAAARRAERQVAALFTLSLLGTALALFGYFAVRPGDTMSSIRLSNTVIGLGIFLAMMGIGLGAIHWAKTLMRDHEMVEERHELRSSDETRADAVQMLRDGAKDSGVGVGRRGLIKGSLVAALLTAPFALLIPYVGNLGGDWNVSKFKHTVWKKGTRLTRDPDGTPIKASEVTIGSVFHVIPEGLNDLPHHELMTEKSKAVVLLVRLDPRDLKPQGEKDSWGFDGIVAFSKICTHVGCPVALYEQQTHHLLCPCHQSTFDVADGAKVVFGPAKRPLPQLPITVDDEGYIVAQSDFHEPIGPSFWERLT